MVGGSQDSRASNMISIWERKRHGGASQANATVARPHRSSLVNVLRYQFLGISSWHQLMTHTPSVPPGMISNHSFVSTNCKKARSYYPLQYYLLGFDRDSCAPVPLCFQSPNQRETRPTVPNKHLRLTTELHTMEHAFAYRPIIHCSVLYFSLDPP